MTNEFEPIEKDIKDALSKTAQDIEKGYPEHLHGIAERGETVVADGAKKVDGDVESSLKKAMPSASDQGAKTAESTAEGEQSKISQILGAEGKSGSEGSAGSWEGENGLHLSAEENTAADQFLGRAKNAESNITPVVMDVKNGVPGAEAVGYPDFVLKSPESFKRKLATTLDESPTRDLGSSLADMKDSVRYTLKFPEGGYTGGVNQTISKFQDAGFENVKFKNTWGSDAYKGINSFWRDPQTGHVFEMQFHTQDSFDAKMDTHELYEQARLPGVSSEQVQALQDQQNQIFGSVPRPPGATGIKLPETRK